MTEEQIEGINEAFGSWNEGWNAALERFIDECQELITEDGDKYLTLEELKSVIDRIKK